MAALSQRTSPVAWKRSSRPAATHPWSSSTPAGAPTTPSRDTRRSRPSTRCTSSRSSAAPDGGVQEPRLLQPGREPGETADGQPVPRGDHLVVAVGTDTGRPRGEQSGPDVQPAVDVVRVLQQLQHRGPVLEGPGVGHREQLGGPGPVVLTQGLDQLLRRPDVEHALLALGVGVQGRGEAALGSPELAQQELGDPLRGPQRRRRTTVGEHPHQQGVVIEHLLEVGHHPARVDAVAREPAPELVVQATAHHARRWCGRPCAGPRRCRAAGGTRAPSTAGTSGRHRIRRRRGRSRPRGR